MIRVTSVEEMVAIEKATDASGVTYDDMMENAGRGVAEVVMDVLGGVFEGRRVVVLAGPGNNGGDGLVAARVLAQETPLDVSCYLLQPRDEGDKNFILARDAGVFLASAPDDQRWRVLKNLIASADVVVDALLGTGTRLPLKGDLKTMLSHVAGGFERGQGEALKAPGAPVAWAAPKVAVVAVDCPTGLDCDTGELDAAAIPADVTVTFAAAKAGHLRFPGAAAVGRLVVADIGIPEKLPEWKAINVGLADPVDVRASLPVRPGDGHKGTFGRVVVLAGSVNYTGAAYLAGLGAYRMGAGLVTMAVPQPIFPTLSSLLPEATWLLLPHSMGVLNEAAAEVYFREMGEAQALLMGPGLGRDHETAEFIHGLFQTEHHERRGAFGFVPSEPAQASASDEVVGALPPLIVDADGLNLLSEIDNWWKLLPPDTILTPHPGEMARLTGLEREAIQADRVGVAIKYAAKWKCVVVLKGAFTVVAAPNKRAVIQPFASAALAKGGTGDVLAGAMAGLLAQGMPAFEAATAAAYLHGLAGQIAALAAGSPRSLLAGDVAAALGAAFHQLEGNG